MIDEPRLHRVAQPRVQIGALFGRRRQWRAAVTWVPGDFEDRQLDPEDRPIGIDIGLGSQLVRRERGDLAGVEDLAVLDTIPLHHVDAVVDRLVARR